MTLAAPFIHPDTPWALYNEIDDYAADWLERLVQRGLIAPGVVVRSSIEDIAPLDIAKFTQVHLFAGIGVWSHSLRRAGWPDDRRIWTGSCPCQPFSAAGKGGGFADERHLWPAMLHLIRECRPDVVLGEQVASKDGLAWFDVVQSDFQGEDYACGIVDTCSASVGAPHIRQRLRFAAYRLADAACQFHDRTGFGRSRRWDEHSDRRDLGRMAFPNDTERRTDDTGGDDCNGSHARWPEGASNAQGCGCAVIMADPNGRNACAEGLQRSRQYGLGPQSCGPCGCGHSGIGHNSGPGLERPGPTNGFWSDCDWLLCRDGKWRPVEPGTFPLAHGAPARVGRLRAYGNAVDAEATTEFCAAVMDYLRVA